MRKIISILLVLLTLLGSVTCLTGCTPKSEAAMTKGEWIEMLAAEFGLDDYTIEEPAFKDISKEHELYASVQSCVDCRWSAGSAALMARLRI